MQRRTAAFALAVFVGSAAGIGLSAIPGNAAHAADECLSGPKASTPAGGHWYYRIEKGTKRKCWYLADEGGKTNKAASTTVSDSTEPDPPPAKSKVTKPSVANARAELTATSDDQQALAETTWPPMPDRSAAATAPDNQPTRDTAAASTPATPNAQGWNMASRWPEPAAVNSTDPQTKPVQMASNDAAPPATAPAPAPVAAPPPVAAAPAPVAEHPALAAQSDDDVLSPFRILLIGLTIALALTAVLGSVLFKALANRRREKQRLRGDRRPIWDDPISERYASSARTPERYAPPAYANDRYPASRPRRVSEQPPLAPRTRGAERYSETDVRIDEIEELLRASRDQTA